MTIFNLTPGFIFIIGGILCIMTGFSFARLNYQYPVNDAEYSWILEIMKKKDARRCSIHKERKKKDANQERKKDIDVNR